MPYRIFSVVMMSVATLVLFIVNLNKIFRPGPHDSTGLPGMPYSVWQASEEDICWIAETAKKTYKGPDVIPIKTMMQWYKTNPNGFWVIKDKDGNRCGNLDILPLKPAVMKRFIDSEIIEQEIQAECIYSPAESNKIKLIYIESLLAGTVVDGFLQLKGNAFALEKLLKKSANIIKKLCNPVQIEKVYAIAASRKGKKLLLQLSFVPFSKQRRQCNHDIYFANGPDFANKINSLLGDTDNDPLKWDVGATL